ncbi:MAG TPA: putative Ig domain-containing protein [Steroidobacteraceae bacterium]|nr:putative Ig domain-containing protein [Steroidobacteraceae bacterium]
MVRNRSRFGFLARAVLCASLAATLAACGGEQSNVADDPTQPAVDPTPPPPSTPSPTNNPPVLGGTPPLTAKAGVAYSFAPTASDADNDALSFTITGKPAWASFNVANGTLSGTPGDVDVGQTDDIEITVSDGTATDSIGPFRITIAARDAAPSPTNTAPKISGTPPTTVAAGATYMFVPTATDAENDKLTFSIANRPRWATFSTANGQLSGTPATRDVGTTSNIRISVSDGKTTTALAPFSIQVTAPPNGAPTISGTPSTSVQVGTAYSFQPTASDPNNDTLTWSITNKPAWASFSNTTGKLSGTPGASDVGTTSNIRISVSDGKLSAALPAFSLTVTAGANKAPTISGTPATSVTAGTAYSFKPTASDPDGDTLSYSVQNKPSWASFSIATGQLSGTPTSAGTYANIIISVSDGKASAALAPFTITVTAAQGSPPPPTTSSVTLNWGAPTTNTDGSALTNLAGFRIAYGKSASNLDTTVQVPGTGVMSYTIDGLTSGTWYFTVKSYSSAGVESAPSNPVSATVP